MNIAMVSPYSWAHPGGVNNHISGLAREMRRRGHDVTVIAPDEGEIHDTEFISAGRSIGIPANGSIAHMAVLPPTRGKVRDAVRSGGFNVVHVHEPLVPFVSTSAVSSASCRVVGTFHAAAERRSLVYWLGKTLYSGVIERLDARIAVSEPARSIISKYFPNQYHIIPNGIDVARFAPPHDRPAAFPTGEGPVILFVGRKEKRKGLHILLLAFSRVLEAVPDCRLVVIGEGYGEDYLRKVSRDIGERITVLGYVDRKDLPTYFGASDLLCAPALGGESFGIVLIESMASGTPVVASDIPGYRAVVERTGGGRLFKTGEPESLAGVLVELLKNKGLTEELSRTGLHAVADFSWERLGDEIESCYTGSTLS